MYNFWYFPQYSWGDVCVINSPRTFTRHSNGKKNLHFNNWKQKKNYQQKLFLVFIFFSPFLFHWHIRLFWFKMSRNISIYYQSFFWRFPSCFIIIFLLLLLLSFVFVKCREKIEISLSTYQTHTHTHTIYIHFMFLLLICMPH